MRETQANPELFARTAWIFDMDGTLTLPKHDFDAMRVALALPAGLPILESLRALDDADDWRWRRLSELDWEIADAAEVAPDADRLVRDLKARGVHLGVLTRNRRDVALRTLQACGLGPLFAPEDVLGRDSAPPKPAPDGILQLLHRWGRAPTEAVMVGDFAMDIQAGRAAGVATVLVDRAGEAAPDAADWVVRRLDVWGVA